MPALDVLSRKLEVYVLTCLQLFSWNSDDVNVRFFPLES